MLIFVGSIVVYWKFIFLDNNLFRIQQHVVEPYFKIRSRTAQLRRLQVTPTRKLLLILKCLYKIVIKSWQFDYLSMSVLHVIYVCWCHTHSAFSFHLLHVHVPVLEIFFNMTYSHRGYYTVARRYEFYIRVTRILFLPRELKIHIFEPPCNVLFIIWRLNKRDTRNQFNQSKLWRHWTIWQSQRCHTENTPLGPRMKWHMESTSGLVPSKTLSSI